MAGNDIPKKGFLNGSRNALVVGTLGAILGGTGGPFLLVKLGGPNVLRPNPYTATQALAESKEVNRRLTALENHVDPQNHPDGELRRQLAVVSSTQAAQGATLDAIRITQGRILTSIDNLRE